jgi:predicted RNA-binding Zn-ribbon protein involved in translation (DUF1610 family)
MLIYKITSPNTDLVYVGKTNQTLRQRLQCHHSAYKGWLAGKPNISCTSFKVLEHGGAIIELIEETEDASGKQREEYWINAITNTCNQIRGLFDQAAYNRVHYAENREEICAKSKAYREENKEEISAKNKARYAENKEEICARVKVYREENKEEINAKSRAYHEENKEEICAKRRQKEPCPKCGRIVTRGAMTRHQKGKSCQNHGL